MSDATPQRVSAEEVPSVISALVGRQCREFRKRAGMTQAALASSMGEFGYRWTPAIVIAIEKGRHRVTVDEVVALAILLGVSTFQLIPDPRAT